MSEGEKTLAPTEKRLKDAARDGDTLRSRDLAVAAGMLVGAAALRLGGPWLFDQLASGLRLGLDWNRAEIDDFDPGRLLIGLALRALPPLLVLGGGIIGVTLVAQLGITGPGRMVGGNMLPKARRMNPVSGLARMFGPQGWIEVGKGLLKIGLLGSIAWVWGRGRIEGLIALGGAGLAGQLAYAWAALTSLLFMLAAGLMVLGLIDFPIQWIRRRRRLRMSLQDMRDEHKEANGAPEAKAAMRRRQRQVAMSGIVRAVQGASFVITNPTHFAVALSWDPDKAPAPVVVAKGRGEKALAIRELAGEYALPCLEFPGLARSVYYTTQERQMIREELYGAVAGVLAFVFALKRGEGVAAPAIEVPVELRFDADGRLEPAP